MQLCDVFHRHSDALNYSLTDMGFLGQMLIPVLGRRTNFIPNISVLNSKHFTY